MSACGSGVHSGRNTPSPKHKSHADRHRYHAHERGDRVRLVDEMHAARREQFRDSLNRDAMHKTAPHDAERDLAQCQRNDTISLKHDAFHARQSSP